MVDRRLVEATSLVATISVVAAGLDMRDAPVGIVVLVFLLLGPGFALTLLMGPMHAEARLLASVAGSVALGTLTSLALLAAGMWSGLLGVAILAAFTQVCVVVALRRRRTADAPTPHRSGEPASCTDCSARAPTIERGVR